MTNTVPYTKIFEEPEDFLDYIENLHFTEQEYKEAEWKPEPCRRFRGELLQKAYAEGWLGPLEFWLRQGHHLSGVGREDQLLEVDMDVSDRTKLKYIEKCIDLDLMGTDGDCIWIRSTEHVEKIMGVSGPRVRWYPDMPLREFTYAVVVMLLMNYFAFLPALRTGSAKQDLGGVSLSQMAEALGITKSAASYFRRRCENLGLLFFKRRWVSTDYSPEDLEHMRSLKLDDPALTVDEGRVYREVTSSVEAGTILLSIRQFKDKKLDRFGRPK